MHLPLFPAMTASASPKMSGRMGERHEHLLGVPTLPVQVNFDDGVAAGETVLIA